MKNLFLLIFIVINLNAKDNNSTNLIKESNKTTKDDIIQQQIKKQMAKEQKYAKEQVFYQGSDYNLSSLKVNEKSLSSINVIEPDYDFNMDDAYSDEQ